MNATAFEPISDVAFVTAIFPAPIAVNVELLAAVSASEMVDRFSLYLVEMAVPPLIAALVITEAFFLPFGNLLNLPSAVLAGCYFAGEENGRHGCRVPVDIVPSAERLYCVHRYSKRLSNLAVSVARSAKFDDLRFLIVGHNPSAPSEGYFLWYLPHSLPKNSTHTVMA